MRTLINYLRQAFCKHDWNVEEDVVSVTSYFETTKNGTKVYMRCNKCGYHKNHWKYL